MKIKRTSSVKVGDVLVGSKGGTSEVLHTHFSEKYDTYVYSTEHGRVEMGMSTSNITSIAYVEDKG